MICSGVVVMFDAWSPLAARRGELGSKLGAGTGPGQARVGAGTRGCRALAMCVSHQSVSPGQDTGYHQPLTLISASESDNNHSHHRVIGAIKYI